MLEALCQVVVGYFVVLATQTAAFYVMSIDISFEQNLWLVLITSIVAFFKSLAVRSYFRSIGK